MVEGGETGHRPAQRIVVQVQGEISRQGQCCQPSRKVSQHQQAGQEVEGKGPPPLPPAPGGGCAAARLASAAAVVRCASAAARSNLKLQHLPLASCRLAAWTSIDGPLRRAPRFAGLCCCIGS